MSSIEWTNVTWNPVSGCTRASEGCDHCYAVLQSYRNGLMAEKRGDAKTAAKYNGLTVLNGKGDRHFNGVVRTHDDVLQLPFKWKKPQRVFVNSMSDLFHKDVPFDFIDKVFAVMALCPQHTFQVLTKRPERMAEYMAAHSGKLADRIIAMRREAGDDSCVVPLAHIRPGRPWWPLSNVWLGTSCENQKAADERIPHLLRCPAAVRFLSCEPLLGAIQLPGFNSHTAWCPQCAAIVPCTMTRFHEHAGSSMREATVFDPLRHAASVYDMIHWVIVGGESGYGSRPCDIDWIRSIVSQCKAAGVSVFVKQMGANPSATLAETGTDPGDDDNIERLELTDRKGGDMSEWPADLRVREFPGIEAIR